MFTFYIISKISGRTIRVIDSQDTTQEGAKLTWEMLKVSFPDHHVDYRKRS